jgi:LPS sulfotransferase NodH
VVIYLKDIYTVPKNFTRSLKTLITPIPSEEKVRDLIPHEGTNKNYKRYVIFGHQRCGSSVLTSGLKSHPNIKAFAEVFTPSLITFNYKNYDNQSLPMLKYRNAHPINFLEKVIFTEQAEDTVAVGFKVFPDQIDNARFEPLWEWLKQEKDIALVMLNRTNSLKTLCSVQIAKKTGVWGIKDAAKRPTIQISLSSGQCKTFFEKREHYANLLRERFKGRELLEISYETFASDIPKYFEQVQNHIGIPPIQLPVNDVKKEVREMKDIISNYSQLKEEFKDTEWSKFFD